MKHYINFLPVLALFFTVSLLISSCQKESNTVETDHDKADIINYVEANQLEGQFTSSGLWYNIINMGSDVHHTMDSRLTIDYDGYLLNGNHFDSKSDYTFMLEDAIPGWQEGLQLVGSGGHIKLIIPPNLTSGSTINQNIPSNSVLVFDITVKSDSIQDILDQAALDKAAIIDYVEDQQLNGHFTESGLYYVITEPGSTNHPNIFSTITTGYNGYLLNGDYLDSATHITFNISHLILGWQEGLQLIGSGGEIKLIIPSGLAYGPNATNNIPPNTVLVFDVRLISFTN